jgi:predicted MFS family arabinose efflux permease
MKTSTSVQLALVNATGFSASTLMPLWLGRIAVYLAMPDWFPSLAVAVQIGAAAAFNLVTPSLFAGYPMRKLMSSALIVAVIGYGLAAVGTPTSFLAGCLISGGALGVLLNATNRVMGSSDHVQKGYAIFVIVEVCFATLLFLGCAAASELFGLYAVFLIAATVAVCAAAFLTTIPISGAMPANAREGGETSRAFQARLALVSFILFFIGQASLHGFLPVIGETAGLSRAQAAQVVGLSMPFGLLGAVLSRLLGERIPPKSAILFVVPTFAVAAVVITLVPSVPLFITAIAIVFVATIFCVPYFFAELGALDQTGRYTSFGPAMMLVGIAIGPSAAVLLKSTFGLRAVGAFSATTLLLSAAVFIAAVRPRLVRSPVET